MGYELARGKLSVKGTKDKISKQNMPVYFQIGIIGRRNCAPNPTKRTRGAMAMIPSRFPNQDTKTRNKKFAEIWAFPANMQIALHNANANAEKGATTKVSTMTSPRVLSLGEKFVNLLVTKQAARAINE
jgi:hypothetical protein